ncbi:MAG: hypothetical protein JNL83_29945 [Myxococcales bacterium]|nr:hypothetical protein [Myxococcales bacterium]
MRSAKWLFLLALTSFGCKRDSSSAKPEGVAPSAPTSTAEADALWAMAPEGAAFGVVIAPRAVGMAEHAWQDIRALFAVAPELAVPNSLLSNQISAVFGKPDIVLADVGLSPKQGAAFFVLPNGGGIAIVPVADRDKFLAATKGTKGTDSDSVGKATCKTIKDTYVCARTPDLFDKLGKAKLKDGLAVVGTRGDIEVVADLPIGPGIKGAAAVQLARGTVVVRAVVGGVPPQYSQKLAQAQAKAPGDRAKTAGFAVMSVAPMLQTALPRMPGKVADVLGAISGPLTLHIPAGTAELDLRLPFSDATAAADLVEHCADIPGFAEAGASFYDGACHVAIPTLGYTLDIWIENNQLRVGKKGGAKPGADVPMTAIGAELADTASVFAFWGRGTLFGPGPAQMPKLPAVPTEMLMGLRGLSVLSELGMSSRVDGDKLHVMFALRTIWSNPDDVVAKLVAISPQTFLDGKASDAAASIAAGAPGSPFAADYKAGTGGMMAPAAVVGMLAAVAIPAFMDYMKKSKRSEAELRLNQIAKSAKVYYIENAAFPAGEAPITPPTACCDGPDRTCAPAGAGWMNEAWSKLDFSIDEPTLFQYRYRSDGKTLEAEAIGDLDCDGNTITYKLHMTAEQGNPTATIEAPPPNTD